MSELPRDAVFAGHRIEDVAGRGGMGVVYRATQLDLDRTVALKVIASPLLDDPSARERFVREARAAARIEHPNVLPVHYVGEEDGTAYIAMRYVPGDDLRSLVRRSERLDPRRAARITAQVAAALDAIHAHGIVHRDVKPANILLGPGDHVYVTDFGLAKQTLSVADTTRPGHWVGTPDYVAPEQIRSERVDARVDVYAFGCVVHYMLTGQVPFPRSGDEARIWAHLSEAPPRPSQTVAGLPEGVDTVIAGALAKQPDDRFGSAGAVGRALLDALERRPVAIDHDAVGESFAVVAEPDGATELSHAETVREEDESTMTAVRAQSPSGATTRRMRRRAPLALGLLALLVAGGVGAALALSGDDEAGPPARSAQATRPHVAARIAGLGPRPNGVAVAAGAVWVTTYRGTRLYRIDAKTNRRLRGIRLGDGAARIRTSRGRLWVAMAGGRKRLLRIDPRRNRVDGRWPLAGNPNSLAVDREAVWVGSVTPAAGDPDVLERFSPRSGRRLGRVVVPEGITSIALTRGGIWVSHRSIDALSRYSTSTGKVTARIELDDRPGDVVSGGGFLWTSYRTTGALSRIALPDGNPRAQLAGGTTPPTPTLLTYAEGTLWFGNYGESTLVRIDGESANPIGEPLRVGLNPRAVAVSGRTAWVTTQGDDSITRVDF